MISGTRPVLAPAFRRAALPLAWYYAITLALPLANGAAQAGAAFVNHALIVLSVPPLLIGLVCAIHIAAQAFASACRAVPPLSRRMVSGRRVGAGARARRLTTGKDGFQWKVASWGAHARCIHSRDKVSAPLPHLSPARTARRSPAPDTEASGL